MRYNKGRTEERKGERKMSEHISCADTAKLVRKAIAEKFPGVKFSVKSKTYSGGASITVSWTDGPTAKAVESVANRFEGSTFDGMIDLKSYHTSLWEGRRVHFGADCVFCNRHHSADLLREAARVTLKRFGLEAEINIKANDGCGYAYIDRYEGDAGIRPFGDWRTIGDLVYKTIEDMAA